MNARRASLRAGAIIQLLLALGSLLYFVIFLIAGDLHDELGLSKALRMPFVVVFAGWTILFAYGGVQTWRASRHWWWPLVVAILGGPLAFVILLVVTN